MDGARVLGICVELTGDTIALDEQKRACQTTYA